MSVSGAVVVLACVLTAIIIARWAALEPALT